MFVGDDVNVGKWILKAVVDDTATTAQSVVFDGDPIDLGELVLECADGPQGAVVRCRRI